MPTKSTKYDSVASKCNGSNPKITFESNQAIQAIENKKISLYCTSLLFYNILSDCQKSDEINYLLNSLRLDKKKLSELMSVGLWHMMKLVQPFLLVSKT